VAAEPARSSRGRCRQRSKRDVVDVSGGLRRPGRIVRTAAAIEAESSYDGGVVRIAYREEVSSG